MIEFGAIVLAVIGIMVVIGWFALDIRGQL